ncbi:MAG: MBL fold metallo-hydrolase [Anaerolineales bacterium]|nr:MBL fold metallo-hydrolase [Anaerolineales bacterium]
MDITWYGFSCFRLTERGLSTIVTDPYDPELGLAPLKLKADVLTISQDTPTNNHEKSVKGAKKTITGAGEYEIGGVFISAIPMMKKKNGEKTDPSLVCVFDYDGIVIAHLGNLSYVPTQSEIERMGSVDVLLVPVGGEGALNPAQAVEVISLIEPSVVIPMRYKVGSESIQLGDSVRFLSEVGISEPEHLPMLKVGKSSFSEETQVILLDAVQNG